jgi:GNAT superfamily N-acetyltransferase
MVDSKPTVMKTMNTFTRLTAIEKQADDFGFMWTDTAQIFDQIQSECEEIKNNLEHIGDRDHLQEEMGDLIHAVFSLCLFMGFDAEETCVKSIDKFERRFAELKRLAQEAGFETLQGQPVNVLLHFWAQTKQQKLTTSNMTDTSWELSPLTHNDIPLIVTAFSDIGWDKPTALYQKYLEEQEKGERCVWIAFKEDNFAGYVTLKWQSEYFPFREKGIPEISDLNVLPKFRKQGVASVLLDLAEAEARTRSPKVGIGFGLLADYGDAQKLYIKRGYIPDGLGITSHYQEILYGEKVCVDDNLVLWLTKVLL